MPMPGGTILMSGQVWSEKWAGYIDCGNGKFRKPAEWNGRTINRYAIEKRCAHCGTETLQNTSNAKKSANAYCSVECKSHYVKARHRGNRVRKTRKHGRGSHVLVRMHEHHRAGRHGTVFEHILVAEQKIGRPIERHERVHHINCIKDDNRPENLFVCADDREHFLIHGTLNDCVAELLASGAIVFDEDAKTYRVVKQ